MDITEELRAAERAGQQGAERDKQRAALLAALTVPARKARRSAATSERDHRELVTRIWAANDAGCAYVDIARQTGHTRERIRQLCDPAYRARMLAKFAAEVQS